MKLALAIVGAAMFAGTTHMGSEAIHLENWRQGVEPSFTRTQIYDIPATTQVVVTVPLNTVPSDLIAAELAALREPDGPPAPPPDVPMDSLCHTLASAAQAHDIPVGVFARLIWQESRFKQKVVSHAGAQGVAQFMPAVAAERGLRDPFDALAALPHSARFLREHVETFGNLGLAAAAYNGGARRVMDWLARRGSLPQETRQYVKSITGHEPERWTEENQIELAVNLPSRAPCEGVADLSREAEPAKLAVQLEPPVAKVVVAARVAAAKAAAAKKARIAAAAKAKAKRGKLLAKGRGGKDKPAAAKVAGKPAAKTAQPAAVFSSLVLRLTCS
jgi:soluble lytic murein transglycosylase-like protein